MGPAAGSDRTVLKQRASDTDCSCCEADWCGCVDRCIDCHAYLKAKGYAVPADAQEAVAAAGRSRWPKALGWRSARMPGWLPVAESDLEMGNSTLEGAGTGLFTRRALPQGTVMPPYQGLSLTYLESKLGGPYVWCPAGPGTELMEYEDQGAVKESGKGRKMSYCVDAEPAAEGNPSRFINAAGSKAECKAVNVEICEIGQVMYYRTTKPVPPGGELVTDYGSNYWEDLESC